MSIITDPPRTSQRLLSLPSEDIPLIHTMIGEISAINSFFRLSPYAGDIREVFIGISKDEMARRSLPRINPYAPIDRIQLRIAAYVPSERRIYYVLDSHHSLQVQSYALGHEYCHLASHKNGRMGIVQGIGGSDLGTKLDEGLTEYLNLLYWEDHHRQFHLRGLSPYKFEMKIIELLIEKWGIPAEKLADAYFNGGFEKFKELVDAKLGEEAALELARGIDYAPSLQGLIVGYRAVLIVKYGYSEAEKRQDLIYRHWNSYRQKPVQLAQIKRDTNEFDTEFSRDIYALPAQA